MSELDLKNLEDYETVGRWLKYVFSSGIRSQSTMKTYLHFLKRFCVFMQLNPDKLIEDRIENLNAKDEQTKRIHEEKLGLWRDSMEADRDKNGKPKKPLARGSVVTAHNIIKSFYYSNYAELIAKSPKSWRTRESSMIVPSHEQLAQMLKRSKRPRDSAIIICLAQSGISIQDFCELIPYGNIKVELEQGIEPLHVPMNRQKLGQHPYDTFFGANAIEYLQTYLKDLNPKPKDLVFPLSARAIEHIVKKTSIRASMKTPITPHRLRAFFNTYMCLSFHSEAKHIPVVDYWMGHVLPYGGAYMVPPLPDQRKLYKDHESAISIPT